jgi:hypothetical protein
MALVRARTIPAERPPLVGEVSVNFLRIEGCCVVSAAEEELLGRKSSGSGLETDITAVGIRHAHHVAKSGANFTDKQRSHGRYSSLPDSDHGV